MSLQFNSSYNANTAFKNYVSSNGSTLTVNEKSNTQESLQKEVIVIDDDSDNDETTCTQNPEFLYNNYFPNEAKTATTQYRNKGNLKVSDFPCIATKGNLYGTDDMVISNIAVQSDQDAIQLVENTVIRPNCNEKQDFYDLYYKEAEEMLSKVDQVKDRSTDVKKADSSNADDLLCGRYGITTTYCNDDDKGKETIDELNSGATNSAIESAKQRITERYKLLQPKKSNMEEDDLLCGRYGIATTYSTDDDKGKETIDELNSGATNSTIESAKQRIAERFELLQPKKSNMEKDEIHEQTTLHAGLGTLVLRCIFCEKIFTGASMLATHMSLVHSRGYKMETKQLTPEKLRLENCDILRNNQNSNIHSKEVGVNDSTNAFSEPKKEQGSLMCTLCGMKFITHCRLKVHFQKHAGEHTLKCYYCGKSFEQKTQFYKHLRTHSGGKPYKCSYCEKAFATKLFMDQHLRTHTGEKPYECPYCGKAFTQKTHMNQHLRTHTGEKPYKCSYCDKAFAQKSHLDQHLRTHTGEKPYKCSYCGKKFAQKSNLNQHLRTHK